MYAYLDTLEVDEDTRRRIEEYLTLIKRRTEGMCRLSSCDVMLNERPIQDHSRQVQHGFAILCARIPIINKTRLSVN